jgi:hypothetical protein
VAATIAIRLCALVPLGLSRSPALYLLTAGTPSDHLVSIHHRTRRSAFTFDLKVK